MELREWVYNFFRYSVAHKKAFYWQWDRFMLTMRVRGRGANRFYEGIIEIPLEIPPYLVQSSFTIAVEEVLPVLMRIYDIYPSHLENVRNVQSSTRFLSFKSFLYTVQPQKIVRETIRTTKDIIVPVEGFLALYDILPQKIQRRTQQTKKEYPLDQLIQSIG